ncbi:MAG: threonylcarbamoyl-AMP synthase [Chryseobacterium sp.]|nr:MAG: threonylcarbamoyl-AMP synthase [Chryseobacterium sp.]
MEHAIEILKAGGTLLYPTDTIWGIGCDATNADAIRKIFEIKKRDRNKSMIILVEVERRLQDLVNVPEIAWQLIDLSEKPITLVYDNPRGLPAEVLAPDGSIGIRLTKDPLCKNLIKKLGAPLVSTSANLSGDKAPMQFSDISQEIKDAVDYVLPERQDQVSEYPASSVIRVWDDGRIKVLRE